MLRFFQSIKTSVGIFLAAITFLFAGTLIIPKTMDIYTGIVDTLLIDWLRISSPTTSWWVIGLVASLALLVINTVVCSINSIRRGLGRKGLMALLTPHLVHLGVIIMLLGHLVTSVTGMRAEAVLAEGGHFSISESVGFTVKSIEIESSEETGTLWRVLGSWTEGGKEVQEAALSPGSPLYRKGIWIFIKSADINPHQSILMAHRDPGAAIMGVGSALFALALVMLVIITRQGRTEGIPSDSITWKSHDKR